MVGTVQYSTVQCSTVTHFLKDFLHEDREDVDVEVVFLHRWGCSEDGEDKIILIWVLKNVFDVSHWDSLLLGNGDPVLATIYSQQ